jgi:U3 small nucleolar RNA-associated protein 10
LASPCCPLLAALQSDGGDSAEVTRNVEDIVVKIINVFVDALPHVPEHRRLPVLVQLVDTLGAERFLWVLLVLLFEQYVTKTVLAAAYGEKVRAQSGVRRENGRCFT